MRKRLFCWCIFLWCAGTVFSVETITLKIESRLGELLERNDVFVKPPISGFDCEDDILYLLDSKYGTVLVIDMKTGKLQKNIASKGQGPADLQSPTQIIVKNDKLYILDRGWQGIKIFAKDGR